MIQSTEKSLGQVMYEARQEAFAIESRYPWDALAASVQEAFDAQAQAVAAVVREQAVLEAAMQRNRADLLAEDIEALHMCLDHRKVPREDDAGAIYSMWGRVLRLVDATREQCAQACEQERLPTQPPEHPGDEAYERAITDCVRAIRSMKP